MVRRALFGFYGSLALMLQNPLRVFWVCLSLICINFLLDGSPLRLWSLRREQDELRTQVAALKVENNRVKTLIKRASDPGFIEREARDRFDLVEESDLVFIFSQDN